MAQEQNVKSARKQHNAGFKAKVALAAINGDDDRRAGKRVRGSSKPDPQLEEAAAGRRGGCA
jgi:hypothetical protein